MKYPVIDTQATGKKIKQLRKEKKIKVSEMARALELESEQAIYKWQRGDSLPSIDNLYALSRLFGTPIDDIIQERGEEGESPLPFMCG